MTDGLNMQARPGEPESALLPGIMAAPSHPIATAGQALSSEPGPPQPLTWQYDFNDDGQARASFPGEVDFGEDEAPLSFPVMSVVQTVNVPLTGTGAPSVVTSLTLPAGEWDITAEAWFQGGSNTQNYIAAISASPGSINGLPSLNQSLASFFYGATPNLNGGVVVGSLAPLRIPLISPVTFYLNASMISSGGNPAAGGVITARQFPNPNLTTTIDLVPSEVVPLSLPGVEEKADEGSLDRTADIPPVVVRHGRRMVSYLVTVGAVVLALGAAAVTLGGRGVVAPVTVRPVVLEFGDIRLPPVTVRGDGVLTPR